MLVLLQHILPFVDLPQVRWMLRLMAHAQVNYVGKAANLYQDAGYQLSGSAYVVNKHLGTTWLWDRVRVSGGAYGGFSDFDTHSGMFSYLSYRDPNLTKTVRVLCIPAPAASPSSSHPPPAPQAAAQCCSDRPEMRALTGCARTAAEYIAS